jgi:hypothetical protein
MPRMKVKTYDQMLMQRVEECTTLTATQYGQSILPIYRYENDRPAHEGSSLLLRVNGRPLLLTAAHIIDQNKNCSLCVGSNEKLVPLVGTTKMTNKPDDNRNKDRLDFALIQLAPETVGQIGDVPYISDNDIDRIPNISADNAYTAIGYPNSKNKKILGTRDITSKKKTHTAPSVMDVDVYQKLRLNPEHHILIVYDEKYTANAHWTKIKAVSPKGFSGGGLFDLGPIKNVEVLAQPVRNQLRLVGMIIEMDKTNKVLVATRLGVILDLYEQSEG